MTARKAPIDDVSEDLRSIYTEKDGAMPDLTRLERTGASRLTRFLAGSIVVLGLLSAAAWAGFFVWNRGIFDAQTPLTVTIEGQETIRAGERVYLTISYHNRARLPVSQLEMKLNLPLGFEMLSASPEPTDGTTWNFGTLSAESDGSVVISGIFRSEVPSTQTLQAFFTYAPANTSSEFQEIGTWRADIQDSVLDAAITGPEKALPGDEATYLVEVRNSGSERLERVRVTASLPSGFAVTSSEPAVSSPDVVQWDIDAIEPGAIAPIVLRGRFASTVSGDQLLTANVSLLTADTTVLAQTRADVHTDVLGGNLAFHLVANGSSETVATDLGDAVRVSIDWANQGNERIEGVVFTLNLDGSGKPLPINWEAADLGGGSRTGSSIVWSATQLETFGSMDPNASGIIDLNLPVVVDPANIADRFTMTLTASLQKVGSVESPRTIESTPITVSINSDLTAFADARYYTDDGEPIGTGPLPPKAGETTTYRIFWDVANTLHPLSNVVLTTNLPPDVVWIDKKQTDIGTITFDEITRLVRWTIPKLPTDIKTASGFFDVAITPDEDDAGAFFKLTNATSVDARDDVTGDNIAHALDILTTELPNDANAAGKGIVAE